MTTKKASSFEGLSVDEIAAKIEHDIKAEARKWKKAHPTHHQRATITAATSTAALYLHAHTELYIRETAKETRDMHEHWMALMQAWFLSIVKQK